jgi:hypothetical protein
MIGGRGWWFPHRTVGLCFAHALFGVKFQNLKAQSEALQPWLQFGRYLFPESSVGEAFQNRVITKLSRATARAAKGVVMGRRLHKGRDRQAEIQPGLERVQNETLRLRTQIA